LPIQKGGHELPRKGEGISIYPPVRAAEAWQIESIDLASLREGPNIISPILAGGSQAVDQKEWTPLAQDPIAGINLPHFYVSVFRVLHHRIVRGHPSPAVPPLDIIGGQAASVNPPFCSLPVSIGFFLLTKTSKRVIIL
jgi:hypothetical protein